MTVSVVVAPTAFKGTLSPTAAADSMARGVAGAWPRADIVRRPLSDGGTGLLDACRSLEDGHLEELAVTGPLGGPTSARVLRAGETAIVESAEACGIHLVPPGRRDPLVSTTRGVGELLLATREYAGEIVLGLGGSATVDGGTGMARALGWRFSDAAGRLLPEGGGGLVDLHRIEPPAERWNTPVVALCDVENPLIGADGAARIYGPQKGAGPADVERLEAGLARLAVLIEAELGLRLAGRAGAGAAGGLGAGACAFLGAELVSGAEWVIGRAGLGGLLSGVDLVITGEGRFDAQSAMGKVTGRVIEAARSAGVPVLLVCGRVDGPVPLGVHVAEGTGGILEADDLAYRVESACRGLAL